MSEISLENYRLIILFDSLKNIDSKRRNEIKNIYNDSDYVIKRNEDDLFVVDKEENTKGIFTEYGITIIDDNLDYIVKAIKKAKEIFDLNMKQSKKIASIEANYLIKSDDGNKGIINQTDMIAKLIGKSEILVSSIEFFDLIEKELGVFVKVSVSGEGLKIKISCDFLDGQDIYIVTRVINRYVDDYLKSVLFEDDIDGDM